MKLSVLTTTSGSGKLELQGNAPSQTGSRLVQGDAEQRREKHIGSNAYAEHPDEDTLWTDLVLKSQRQ